MIQKSSALFSPSPLVLQISVFTSFKMSLFRMDVAKRVVAHTLGKVNGIQHFYPVAAPHKELAHLADQTSFRVSNHE